MINSKEELKEYINFELNNYSKSRLKRIVFTHVPFVISESQILMKFHIILRKCEYYVNCNKKIRSYIYKVKLNRYKVKYSLNIPVNTFGKGLKIMHIGPILVNHNAKIGENCSIHINTAIVAGGKNHIAPKIGDNAIIFVGTTILGDVTIGDNAIIGANSLVNKSFGDNSTIVGNPARAVSK